jgi:cyclic pyranopterin phosphate synthase
MNDTFDREINYLRISITDRCNLRCLYCMPESGVDRLRHRDILRYEEITDVVKAAADLGVTSVRITGGEPLVRPGASELIKMIADIRGVETVSLTTNGILLQDYAQELADAGLQRVNISLDSLDPDKYRVITRNGGIERVFRGIEAAAEAGLMPVKINSVIIRGFNDHEIIDLSEWALSNDLHLRFIEFMPVNDRIFPFKDGFVSSDEITGRLFSHFDGLVKAGRNGSGPAESWIIPSSKGSVGVIGAVSHSFCGTCNRLRLTADGKLKPCLFSEDEIDLVGVLRNSSQSGPARTAGIAGLIRLAAGRKPASHGSFDDILHKGRFMNEIGG